MIDPAAQQFAQIFSILRKYRILIISIFKQGKSHKQSCKIG
jgi:hypothetical protein